MEGLTTTLVTSMGRDGTMVGVALAPTGVFPTKARISSDIAPGVGVVGDITTEAADVLGAMLTAARVEAGVGV